MDAHPVTHLTDQTLSSYGLGKLDDASAEAVNQHLEQCADCRKRVAEMSADSFLGRIRDAQKAASHAMSEPSQPDKTQSYEGSSGQAAPRTTMLPPGLAEHPDYEIRRELGRGGMGVVYLAHNRLMARDEVLKVMGPQIVEEPGVLDRFLREIRAVARLRHPNIVSAYTAFRCGKSLVFAMEYVAGLDLARMVKAKGPMPVGNACNYVHQAALGLQHAHEEGMVHRDIKPGNLMLSYNGNRAVIKVLDFGLAKASREQYVSDRHQDESMHHADWVGSLTAHGPDARHSRLHRSRTDRRRPEGRHPRRHLQPRLHAVLSVERPGTVSGDATGRSPGPLVNGRQAAKRRASGGAGRVGGRRGQDDGEGARPAVPGAGRGRPGAVAILQEAVCRPRSPGARGLQGWSCGSRSRRATGSEGIRGGIGVLSLSPARSASPLFFSPPLSLTAPSRIRASW